MEISLLLNHYFRRFHNHANCVAGLEVQFLGTSPGDHAFNDVLAHSDDNMSHHVAQFDVFDNSGKLVSS